MMKTWTTRAAAAMAAVLAMTAAPAMAQDVGAIATDLTGQISSIGTMIAVISFVLGVAVAIAGLMKFRAHSQNPNDPSNKMSTAFVLMFTGAALVAIPAVLGSGISTVFGDSADQTNGTTGFGNAL